MKLNTYSIIEIDESKGLAQKTRVLKSGISRKDALDALTSLRSTANGLRFVMYRDRKDEMAFR